jgi:hypothetical protein
MLHEKARDDMLAVRLPRSMATKPCFTGYLFSSHHHNAFLDTYSRTSQTGDSMPA